MLRRGPDIGNEEDVVDLGREDEGGDEQQREGNQRTDQPRAQLDQMIDQRRTRRLYMGLIDGVVHTARSSPDGRVLATRLRGLGRASAEGAGSISRFACAGVSDSAFDLDTARFLRMGFSPIGSSATGLPAMGFSVDEGEAVSVTIAAAGAASTLSFAAASVFGAPGLVAPPPVALASGEIASAIPAVALAGSAVARGAASTAPGAG